MTLAYIKRLYLATKAINSFQKLKVSKAKVIQMRFKNHILKSKGNNNSNLVEYSIGFAFLIKSFDFFDFNEKCYEFLLSSYTIKGKKSS